MKRILLYCCFFLVLETIAHVAKGEGTRELMPNNTNGTGLIVSTTATFPLGKVGSYLGCPIDNRIYFNIKDFTRESLYYGFHWNFLTIGGVVTPYTDVYMRIYDPTGALVQTVKLLNAGAGFIGTYASAVAGPNILGSTPAGYSPKTFNPLKNGNYWLELYRSADGGATEMVGGESMLSPLFDLTVAKTNGVQYPGRVHCNLWAFSVYDPATNWQSPSLSSEAPFYAYSTDSVITQVKFQSGFRPLAFVIALNIYGVQNTGNWFNDRRSINTTTLPALSNGYNVFLNVPDPTLYPVCGIPVPPTLVDLIIAGCPPGPYSIRFNAPQAGDYAMLLDLNGIPGYQGNSRDRFFELINQVKGIVSVPWDGLDGLGVFVPPNVAFPITFSFRKGRVNVPLYDDELNVTGFTVSGIAPVALPNSRLYWNDTLLIDAGIGLCTSAKTNNNNTGIGYLNDIVGQPSPGHAWNGDGNGGFAVPAPAVAGNDVDNIQCNDFGNARLMNTWCWGIELYITQSLTLACVTISGTVWDDADNSAAGTFVNIKTNTEIGTNAGNVVYASLIDPVTNNVLASVPVNANGTYSIYCPVNSFNMRVIISATAGVVGSPAPATGVPSSWINTSPLVQVFNTQNADISGKDFGVEQLPNSDVQTYTIPAPPVNTLLTLNGTGAVGSPGPLSGSDPEDGSMGSGKKVVITQIPVNSELYYNGVLVTNNTTIINYNPSLLRVKFTVSGVLSVFFQYAFVDAAGKQDPTPALYTINTAWVLPTMLTSFTANKSDHYTKLNWITASKNNVASYVIERSTDGNNFQTIGSVRGANLVNSTDYVFSDNNPSTNAINYYRLKLVSPTGSSSYSKTLAISFTGRAVAQISPNPFKDVLVVDINLEHAGKVSIRLMDMKGIVLKEITYKGDKGGNVFYMTSLSYLPASVYVVQVVLPDQLLTHKVLNQ